MEYRHLRLADAAPRRHRADRSRADAGAPLTGVALVVNADDLGVATGADLGILRAHREGVVTSASLAPAGASYAHALDEVVSRCPALGIGLHFTLTSGRPVSPAADVPLLVGPDGFFRRRFTDLLAACSAPGASALLAQIGMELEAQLDRLRSDGVSVDHIDGERHVHLIPGIFELVAAAARRRSVPFVRAGADAGWSRGAPLSVAVSVADGGAVKSLLLGSLAARARARLDGVRTAGLLGSYLFSGRAAFLPRLLAQPPEGGVVEAMVHPGVPERSAGASLGNAAVERYLRSPARAAELEACVAARPLPAGWSPTTFGALARRESR